MPRIGATTEQAHETKALIHQLREQGLGYGVIAQRIGVSRGYVQQVCKKSLLSVTPHQILQQAINLKEENPHYGPMQIKAILHTMYPDSPVPSESKLGSVFRHHNLCQSPLATPKDYRPYWMTERPASSLHTFEIDTVKLKDRRGSEHEILTVTDGVTHITWAERLPNVSGYILWGIARAFQVMGVPKVVQSFIPVAEAKRNGAVERFHKTLRHEWNAKKDTIEDLAAWLNTFLHDYNTIKPHSELGGKAARTTPAQAGTYQHLSVAQPEKVSPTGCDSGRCQSRFLGACPHPLAPSPRGSLGADSTDVLNSQKAF